MFDGLNPDRVVFSGNSRSGRTLHLLYDRDNEHYNVNTNLKGAMVKQYICNGYDTLYDIRTNVTSLLPVNCYTTMH